MLAGQPYRTSWVIEAPYAGFYGLKGTVDNGRILVDGRNHVWWFELSKRGLEGFKSKFPQTVKFPLSEGSIPLKLKSLINTDTFEKVNKKFLIQEIRRLLQKQQKDR